MLSGMIERTRNGGLRTVALLWPSRQEAPGTGQTKACGPRLVLSSPVGCWPPGRARNRKL